MEISSISSSSVWFSLRSIMQRIRDEDLLLCSILFCEASNIVSMSLWMAKISRYSHQPTIISFIGFQIIATKVGLEMFNAVSSSGLRSFFQAIRVVSGDRTFVMESVEIYSMWYSILFGRLFTSDPVVSIWGPSKIILWGWGAIQSTSGILKWIVR